MNYKKKRIKSGLSIYTIAKELGIDENRYKKLEQGKVHLEYEKLEKFLDVIRRSKEILFNRKVRLTEIDEWIRNGNAEKDMKAMGYNQKELSNALGYTDSYVNGVFRNFKKASDDFKEKMYDFLKDPFNKKIIDKEIKDKEEISTVIRNKNSDIDKKMLDEWIESGQAKRDIIMSGYSQVELSKMMGYEKSYVGALISRKKFIGTNYIPKQKLYDFLHNNKELEEEEIVEEVSVVSQSPVVEVIELPEEYTITTATYEIPADENKEVEECPNCDAVNHILESMNSEFDRLKERYETLDAAYKLVAKENAELLKENQYLKESIRRMFKL